MADEQEKVNRDDIAADLERARIEFHRLLAAAGPDDWGEKPHFTSSTYERNTENA